MALGAWRLMKLGVVVKNTSTVETLGSASIICLDKTGTITENRMKLSKVFSLATGIIYEADAKNKSDITEVVKAAMWASEPIPFDPMEVALHEAYGRTSTSDERTNFQMIHEYPLGGKPPMMTHIFEDAGGDRRIIAAKGAPEAMMEVSNLTQSQKDSISNALNSLTLDGFRVLGVGISDFAEATFPKDQQQLSFSFLGLVAFNVHPKEILNEYLTHFIKLAFK